uniref:Uncharacterized protein n=1 Tax=Arundo donax TaxID=35708 RepID=A0A0A9DKS8_ARUDO
MKLSAPVTTPSTAAASSMRGGVSTTGALRSRARRPRYDAATAIRSSGQPAVWSHAESHCRWPPLL